MDGFLKAGLNGRELNTVMSTIFEDHCDGIYEFLLIDSPKNDGVNDHG